MKRGADGQIAIFHVVGHRVPDRLLDQRVGQIRQRHSSEVVLIVAVAGDDQRDLQLAGHPDRLPPHNDWMVAVNDVQSKHRKK